MRIHINEDKWMSKMIQNTVKPVQNKRSYRVREFIVTVLNGTSLGIVITLIPSALVLSLIHI